MGSSPNIGWGGSYTATPNSRPPGWQCNCHPNVVAARLAGLEGVVARFADDGRAGGVAVGYCLIEFVHCADAVGSTGQADSWTRRLYTVRQDLSTKFLATSEAYGTRPAAAGVGIPEFSPELPTTKDGPLLGTPQSLVRCPPLFNRLTNRLSISTPPPGVSPFWSPLPPAEG